MFLLFVKPALVDIELHRNHILCVRTGATSPRTNCTGLAMSPDQVVRYRAPDPGDFVKVNRRHHHQHHHHHHDIFTIISIIVIMIGSRDAAHYGTLANVLVGMSSLCRPRIYLNEQILELNTSRGPNLAFAPAAFPGQHVHNRMIGRSVSKAMFFMELPCDLSFEMHSIGMKKIWPQAR